MKSPNRKIWSAHVADEPGAGETIWDLMEGYNSNLKVDVDAAWDSFTTQVQPEPKHKGIRRILKYAAIAASVAATLLLVNQFAAGNHDLTQHYATTVSTSEVYQLADASTVTLMPASSMDFIMSSDKRSVQLQGEARFAVEKNPEAPFSVLGNGFELVVVGTQFTVVSDQESSVHVHEGIVKVRGNREADWTTLTAGDRIVISNQLVVHQQEVPTLPILSFEDVTLSSVVTSIEATRNVKLDIPKALSRCTVTADFTGDDTATIVQAIAVLFSAELLQQGDRFILKGGSCK